jgi:hypothetical protein
MWISVNLDAGSNFYEFNHILASSRMQPMMATKSWLILGCSRQADSRGGLRICNTCYLKFVTDID